MYSKLGKLMRDESGITALETALILMAFVVVSAVFAFTVLSAGTVLTGRSERTAYAGLEEVRGPMELRGSVIAMEGTTANTVGSLAFNLAVVAGGSPVDLNDTDGDRVVHLLYRDANQSIDLNGGGYWTVSFIGDNNGDKILEANELAEITVDLDGASLNPGLGASQNFVIEILLPSSTVLLVERTTPARIDTVTALH